MVTSLTDMKHLNGHYVTWAQTPDGYQATSHYDAEVAEGLESAKSDDGMTADEIRKKYLTQ